MHCNRHKMAAVDLYAWYKQLFVDAGDARTKGWFLTDSLVAPSCIVLAYLLLVTRVLPAFMAHRQPLHLRPLILAYNVVQVFANLFLIWMSGSLVISDRLTCMEVLTSDTYRNAQIPLVSWVYYMLKYVDLADSFFFVLTKKQRLVTMLHLYHHTSVVLVMAQVVKFYPSGVLALIPYVNSWMHVPMYGYYFCALYFGNVAIKWKRLITTLQLVQFVVVGMLFIVHLVNPWCSFPKLIMLPFIFYMCSFIYLFGRFYNQSYGINVIYHRKQQ